MSEGISTITGPGRPFFNRENVSKYSGPLEEQFADLNKYLFVATNHDDIDTGDSVAITPARPSPNQGTGLKTNNKGELQGFFMIPDHRGKNNQDVPKFATGVSEFALSSNENGEKTIVNNNKCYPHPNLSNM